jgi:hypothetical protein
MRKVVAVGLSVVVAIAFLSAQSKPSIQGVWRVQERVITGANPSSNTTPQPGIYIYTARHYSVVQIPGTSPRPKVTPAKNPTQPTEAEKIAIFPQWQQFNASSGTYEIKGTTLTTKPMVAKNESVMAGPGMRYEFKLDGNTLWLTSKFEDGKTTTQIKLTRLE